MECVGCGKPGTKRDYDFLNWYPEDAFCDKHFEKYKWIDEQDRREEMGRGDWILAAWYHEKELTKAQERIAEIRDIVHNIIKDYEHCPSCKDSDDKIEAIGHDKKCKLYKAL